MSVILSHISNKFLALKSPGIPWNIDIALLAMVYIGIGFYCKEQIHAFVHKKSRKLDILALSCTGCAAAIVVINNILSLTHYYFDMKPGIYPELCLAISIPVLFGIAICRFLHWIHGANYFTKVLAYVGRASIPIMFLHVPLNDIIGKTNGIVVYLLVGIGVPLFFYALLSRGKTARILFGCR